MAAGARAQSVKEAAGSHLDAHTERCQRAYQILNKFLQAFIDHVSSQMLLLIGWYRLMVWVSSP